MSSKVAFRVRSSNSKTGNIPVSTSAASTCPNACPLKANGSCYAKHGPLGMYWAKVNSGAAKAFTWSEFTAQIASLPEGQLWRHNQAGDLPGADDHIDADALVSLVAANLGRKGFTFTHKPMTPYNSHLVAYANRNGFTINLSADNLSEADALAALDVGPVVVVVARAAENHTTPQGRKVVICPAQTRDDVSCKTCGLCARADRSAIVGFRAHGVSAKKAESIALAEQRSATLS